MSTNRIANGRILNEGAMVRALKEKGFYRSGVPRPSEREEPKKRGPVSVRLLTRREMQFVNFNDPEYQQYIKRLQMEEEGATP